MARPKVLIIGGGFGGLYAARALKNAPVDVLVVDRTNHHVFQPLLYQVATATRLWSIDAANRLDAAIRDFQQVLLDRAAEVESVLMPAYTHLQRAQPVFAAHWLLAHFWPLERDRTRVRAAARAPGSSDQA